MKRGLDSLVGLTREKQRFRVQLARCRMKGFVFPHTLLHGVGGTGKTALARAMAAELGYHLIEVEAAELKNRDAINDLLIASVAEAHSHHKPLFFFVDEIHRLSKLQQEAFYYPMKEQRIIQVINHRRDVTPLAPFTLVGATTRLDMLDTHSLVKRFPNRWKINRYNVNHIIDILADIFDGEGLGYCPSVLKLIARRCLGIPRTAHNLAMKVADQVAYRRGHWIESDDLRETFALEGIDSLGLTEDAVGYLRELAAAEGEPRGLDYLAGRLSLDGATIEDTVEPILLYLGFMDRGRGGRVLTRAGLTHLMRSGHCGQVRRN